MRGPLVDDPFLLESSVDSSFADSMLFCESFRQIARYRIYAKFTPFDYLHGVCFADHGDERYRPWKLNGQRTGLLTIN